MSDHELIIDWWDGETETVTLKCLLSGADRPCALIECPVDHEDVTRACIAEHGAVAVDYCWAVEWVDNGGRECIDTSDMPLTRIPVNIEWDEGVVVHPVIPPHHEQETT